MSITSLSLEILDLIEAEKFEEIKEKLENGNPQELNLIAEDLLLRIGSCFGHEKKKDLEELLQVSFHGVDSFFC